MNDSHLDSERLASLADPATTVDPEAGEHLAVCGRCAADVAGLRALRAALADLPDVPPSRPLRFVPPVAAPEPRGGLFGLRRLVAPMVAVGAVLAVVGGYGTFAAMGAMSAGASPESVDLGASGAIDSPRGPAIEASGSPGEMTSGGADNGAPPSERELFVGPSSALIWPVVAAVGIALLIGALVLRFVRQPRAG